MRKGYSGFMPICARGSYNPFSVLAGPQLCGGCRPTGVAESSEALGSLLSPTAVSSLLVTSRVLLVWGHASLVDEASAEVVAGEGEVDSWAHSTP